VELILLWGKKEISHGLSAMADYFSFGKQSVNEK